MKTDGNTEPGMAQTDDMEGRIPLRSWILLGVLVLGYMGVYLCRKNFSVANPLIRHDFGLSKEDLGTVASVSTLAYMVGKFAFGPLIDRIGGRAAFLGSLLFVSLFGALGGLATSLTPLIWLYSLNRLSGSIAWGGMVKLVPGWFPARRLPLAMAVLSLSFVFGGAFANLLAGWIAYWSGNNWRWVMGGPAILLGLMLIACWIVLPNGREAAVAEHQGGDGAKPGFSWKRLGELVGIRRFWIVCALSFTLTLLRETFNTWTVDFFQTLGTKEVSTQIAAMLSMPFDALGALGIVFLGWCFGRIGPRQRGSLLFVILLLLAVLIYYLPHLGRRNVFWATAAVGGVGFLVYGPYSLLAGILSLEIRGRDYVGTVVGIVDGVGYLAAVLAGRHFGRVLDHGGYPVGFAWLAGLAAVSAVLCLGIYLPAESHGAKSSGHPA